MSEKQRGGKAATIATYIIALLALLAGLILPITNLTFSGGKFDFKAAPVMQLAGALATFGLPVKAGFDPIYSFPLKNFDLGAALLFYYALTIVAALILLIPAFAAKPATSRKVITVGELLALSALMPLCWLEVLTGPGIWNLNFIGAFLITILILIIQCLAFKKGSGAVKTLLFLLSAAAALFAALDIIHAVPTFTAPFEKLAGALNGKKPFEANTGLYTLFDAAAMDNTIVTGRVLIERALMNMFFRASELSVTVGNWFALLAVLLVLFNLFLDMLGLGKKTTRLMIVGNVIRYAAELAFVIGLAVTIAFMPSSYGVALYILALISLIQFAIQVVRAVAFRRAARAVAPDTVVAPETAAEETAESTGGLVTPPAAIPAETAAASGEPYETKSYVYNVNTIYNGPSDGFIQKLTTEQKVEFARMFLEKRTGAAHGIPDYIVGGDNSRFFSMLFIYFARIRDLVSEGLMNKFYEEVKLM